MRNNVKKDKKEGITMKGRFGKALVTFQRGEKGITGLETAIILIAFVTVAAVLAYSVLSAGIFSSEKGKQAVYSGLEQAKATMDIVGSVKAAGIVGGNVTSIKFEVTSVLDDSDIDMGKIIMNYTDDTVALEDVTFSHDNLTAGGSDEMLGPSEVALITLNMSTIIALAPTSNLSAYDSFTLELIPTTGATITIERTLPGAIEAIMDLH
jgi:archaeal flagellin FlaB